MTNYDAQIIEIAILNSSGSVILNERIRPAVNIECDVELRGVLNAVKSQKG